MRTAAVLPVKRFELAKQRLGASVADGVRIALARAMVTDVLQALAETSGIDSTIVVTRERMLAGAAREMGAHVIEDETESGQPAAVELGVRHALDRGLERVLCVPGDCPGLDPAELERLLAGSPAASETEVVILPDRHGTGTNGLLLCPPDAIPPAFGPDSCARHLALARAAGVPCRVEQLPSLLLDIDTGADLEVLRERLAAQGPRAPRTRAVLGLPASPNAVSLTAPA
ncbi:MAG TPA: 2-phospho-L-lactate guanylyltransferase [Solirubrobacteraceae bacterium]|jgi:2-phospho-L-lactate guanylyltransferase